MQVDGESSKKARDICKGLAKPSEANSKALLSLFPGLQNRKRKFSPSDECVVAEQHRKKKAGNPSARGRPKMLKVVFLDKLGPVLPKGQARDKLCREGRIKEVPIRRNMTATEVTNILANHFSTGNACEVEYLQAHRDNTLKMSTEQNLDGAGVIRVAGSGSLYLILKKKESSPPRSSPTSRNHTPSSSDSESPAHNSTSCAYTKHLLQKASRALAELQVHLGVNSLLECNYCLAKCSCTCRDLCAFFVKFLSMWQGVCMTKVL